MTHMKMLGVGIFEFRERGGNAINDQIGHERCNDDNPPITSVWRRRN